MTASDTLPATAASNDTVHGDCSNSGTALLGPHCYRCGQPIQGLVRHFSSILGDFLDSVLDFDARIFRTLWPLLARPGFLTREYFAGRRVRYVSPVRLFVFLSIVTFFIAQLVLSIPGDVAGNSRDGDSVQGATTVAQVEARRDEGIQALRKAREQIPEHVVGARGGLDVAIAKIENQAEQRIQQLQDAAAAGKPPPEAEDVAQDLNFNGRPWNAVDNPAHVNWLPAFGNDWINAQIARGQDNIARMQKEPNLIKDAVLGALPSTLFVLLPIFALMLKVAYLFKRRLYMEHLIVALHSHAFLCAALLVLLGLTALGLLLPAVTVVTHVLELAVFIWMPIYLLMMQKRVYGQGWPMTLLKYGVLGVSYVMLLSIGVTFTMLASLVWM